jgi:dynein heavy chain, axonemal
VRILKAEAAENGIYENIVETFFQNRMRQNMHFIICMSPIGENFRNRLRMFPSLINCCQMSWFNEWPKEALLSVSLKFIEKIKQI